MTPARNPSGDGRQKMITVESADGTEVRAYDDGDGPAILMIHPGLDDGRSWAKVAARLSGRFRVVRIIRRHYRLDLPPAPYSITDEAEDVLALAAAVGPPMLVVGHSSGAVVALEAMVRAPAAFAGAVLFEPPVATGPPDPSGDVALARANAAVAAGKPGKAGQIFVRDIVGMPAPAALALRAIVAIVPRMRALVPRQITDLDGVGIRLDAYAKISTPTVLLGAGRSPAHLAESLDALADVLPNADKIVLARRDHTAHQKAPGEVAQVIQTLADKVIPQAPAAT
jgi:pimeloyl-ACP methyl ester carboxylesterase